MTVALGTTLINKGIHQLDKDGGWSRIIEGFTNGTDIFIGAAVTRFGETSPDIDLCGEDEPITGFVLGYTNAETIHANGYYYNDYDNPFADGKWVYVGIPKSQGVYLVLSATNTTIPMHAKLQCVDGVFQVANTDSEYQMIAEEAVTGAANTRKYFYARWVKNA